MAVVLSSRVILLYCALLHFSLATRFLPSIIWDNVNPLLCCPYNWLVVPRVDIYDILGFVCPTSKLIVKQVNDQTRLGGTMNFNLFRREWPGNVTDLKKAVSNGSIHSFCNVSHTDSVRLSTCRNGEYGSFPVKLTHYVFEERRTKYEKYERNKIYVFYSNGNGLESSLGSKQVKCSMLYAVHVVSSEKRVFDVTYGKEVVPSKCECNPAIKPTLALTAHKTNQKTTKEATSVPKEPTLSPTTATKTTETSKQASTKKAISSTTLHSSETKLHNIQTTTTDPKSDEETKEKWLSVPIFIAIIIAVFTLGILCAVIYFKVLKRKPSRDRYDINNKAYFHSKRENENIPNGAREQFITNV